MTDMDRYPNTEELLEFPCDYMFKAFGPNNSCFEKDVREAVASVIPLDLDKMRIRPSSKGSYVCVSVLVRLRSFEQLKTIYNRLREVEGLKFLL